jgi:hypothetical protein
MAKTFHLRNMATSALIRRKVSLLAGLRIPTTAVRASYVEQFLTCGKKNCHCHRGMKHGPFHYLVQCMGVGKVHKFLLKTPAQREQARTSITKHVAFQAHMEELSQINTELLRRGEHLDESPR